MLTFNSNSDINNDPWRNDKYAVLNSLWEAKYWKKLPDSYEWVAVIPNGLSWMNNLYKEMIYKYSDNEKTHSLQDSQTMSILDDLLPKYPEGSQIDIFSFSRNFYEKIEYLETTNPILSLLRLEYENFITIGDIGMFSVPFGSNDNLTFIIEGKVSIKKIKPKVRESVTKEHFSFNEDNGAVLLDGIELWRINRDNREYYFFKCLYENYDKYVSHIDIKNYIIKHHGTIDKKAKEGNSEANTYCSSIKADLPTEVKTYIHSPRRGYTLRNMKQENI